jgi:hypothetical protein
LAIEEQNVISSKFAIGEPNVVPSKLKIREPNVDETNNQCNFELLVAIVSNPNDEILPKKHWKFCLKSGRLDYFKIYIN